MHSDCDAVSQDIVGVSHGRTRGGRRTQYNRMDVLSSMLMDVEPMDVMNNAMMDVDAFFTRNDGFEFEAGRLIICKKPAAVAFIDEWAMIAHSQPRWFTDDESAITNHPDFKEHRHDQSIYNILAYKYGIVSGTCDVGAWITADRIRE